MAGSMVNATYIPPSITPSSNSEGNSSLQCVTSYPKCFKHYNSLCRISDCGSVMTNLFTTKHVTNEPILNMHGPRTYFSERVCKICSSIKYMNSPTTLLSPNLLIISFSSASRMFFHHNFYVRIPTMHKKRSNERNTTKHVCLLHNIQKKPPTLHVSLSSSLVRNICRLW